ncbi:MAG: hypothetical protein MI723_03550, partial [Caulobacterales bacterium]|nr:hypothetical protein [Caulobacterales bacterium]
MGRNAVISIALAAAASALMPGAAAGQSSAFGRHTISGVVDLRAAASDGPREWLDGGLGKTRYGSVDGEGADAEIAEAALVWEPLFTFALSGHAHVQTGRDQGRGAGLVEAFATYRAPPRPWARLSVRAGLFFPPVSLEHDGTAWSPTRTITPSAINAWIGEEVSVVGVEARVMRPVGAHALEARAAAFGANDTAGTLLGFRGWALHDVKTMAGGRFPLEARAVRLSGAAAQAEETQPIREVDGRAGGYAALAWRTPGSLSVEALAYDNNGDPDAVDGAGQYAWRTRFVNAGLRWRPTGDLELLSQAMVGRTQ